MQKTDRTVSKPAWLHWNFTLTQRQLARLCCAVFFLSLLPLVIVALYNYPADDDFGFTLPAARAWVQTHSLGAVFQSIVDHTADIYRTWQGDFASTFLFSLNPMIFNIRLYFLANWYILALLCLSAGYLLKGVTKHWLHAPASVFWIVYMAVMVLMIQFMPSIGDSVYWYNGGQYTVAASYLMLALGLLIRCNQSQSKRRSLFRGVLLALCGVMLGGSFFGPALGAFVILLLVCVFSLIAKSKVRWHSLVALAFFTAAFLISVTAPGNAVRQERSGETLGALTAVCTAVLDSLEETGRWLSPQLLAMLLLVVPVLWRPLKESGSAFRHPLLIAVMLYGMYAATLVPGVYTGFGYGTPRYFNAVYIIFLVALFGSVIYAEGALIRWLERRATREGTGHLLAATKELGTRFASAYLAVCIALLTLGGFGSTIMNRPSVSAVKVLATGEAAQFYREMQERQEYIRVTDSDVVNVRILSVTIPIFKTDKLPFQGIYGRVRYMKWYFELFYNATAQPKP